MVCDLDDLEVPAAEKKLLILLLVGVIDFLGGFVFRADGWGGGWLGFFTMVEAAPTYQEVRSVTRAVTI